VSAGRRVVRSRLMASGPRLSYVLVADRAETIEPVLRRLEVQTAADELEVVAVVEPEGRGGLEARLDGFARAQALTVPSIHPLGHARRLGVEAATAAVVFLGETHTYPHPELVAALVAAHEEPCAAVAPALGNANPTGALSWSIFLQDYGHWFRPERRGETAWVSPYNCSFKRELLLALGPELDALLEPTAGLAGRLRAGGHRFLVEPAARIDHLNVDRPLAWLRERYLHGRLVGSRATGWGPGRRLVYALGSPLVPGLIVVRSRSAIGRANGLLPRGTVAALALAAAVSALGELRSYALGPGDAAEQMLGYEIQKTRFASEPVEA
jgi:hypothetical protein